VGKEELHFATCFSAKQTTKNGKEVLRLAFCGVLRRNKHVLNKILKKLHFLPLQPRAEHGIAKMAISPPEWKHQPCWVKTRIREDKTEPFLFSFKGKNYCMILIVRKGEARTTGLDCFMTKVM